MTETSKNKLLLWKDVFRTTQKELDEHIFLLRKFIRNKNMVMLELLQKQNFETYRDTLLYLIVADIKRWMKVYNIAIQDAVYHALILWYHSENTVKYQQSHFLIYTAIESDKIKYTNYFRSLIYMNLLFEINFRYQNTKINWGILNLVKEWTDKKILLDEKEFQSGIEIFTAEFLELFDPELKSAAFSVGIDNLWTMKYISIAMYPVFKSQWEQYMMRLIVFSRGFNLNINLCMIASLLVLVKTGHERICDQKHVDCLIKLNDPYQLNQIIYEDGASEIDLIRLIEQITDKDIISLITRIQYKESMV